ncbi:MAG: amino acid permease [Clostridiales bacterium]|nr:amino acid permease [Clostridiales bacterium]
MAQIKTENRLERTLGLFTVYAIGTGTMIGAGIFVLPSIAIANAGAGAILSFILASVITIATTLSVTELATGMPRSGGGYYFVSRAMGPGIGTVIGLGEYFSLVFKGAFALVGMAEIFRVILPVPSLVIAVFGGLILLAINYRGAEASGILQNGIVVGLVLILVVFITLGLFMTEPANYFPIVRFGFGSILSTSGLVLMAYLGITQLAAISEEVRNPAKNIPIAFLGSVITISILYLGIMLVVIGVIPFENVITMENPLAYIGTAMIGRVGFYIMIIAGLFATVSTANAAILSSSRYPFAMSRDNLIFRWLVVIHPKHGTPHRAIVVTGLTMILLVTFFNVEALARLGSTFGIIAFVLINIAILVFRHAKRDWYQPTFKVPLFPITQIIGIIGCLLLLPQQGTLALVFTAIIALVGIIWFVIYGRGKAIPDYNLLDMLEREKVPVRVKDIQDKRVLIAISNIEQEDDLIRLGNHLGDRLIGLHVNKVPLQTSLREAREDYLCCVKEDAFYNKIKEEFEKEVDSKDKKQKFLEVFSHDVAVAILNEAEQEKADLIIMGWQRDKRLHQWFGSVTNHVLSYAKSHIAILKGFFPEEINKILVPYGGGDNSRYAFYLAKRLALSTGATIKLLRVINPDLDEEKRKEFKDEIIKVIDDEKECQIEHEIKERYSRTDAIIDAAAEVDLLILGDSNERFRLSLLGNVTWRISNNTKIPLLIVKRYRPLTKGGVMAFWQKWKVNKSL